VAHASKERVNLATGAPRQRLRWRVSAQAGGGSCHSLPFQAWSRACGTSHRRRL